MRPGIKIGLGIFTSIATAGFILTYDFYIKDRIDSTEVVVVKAGEEIQKSELLTEDKLTIERRGKEALIDGVILAKDIDQIIGYDAKQDIYGNSIVSSKMIDFEQMVPNAKNGEAIRPITKDMIFAKPGSLRRKDIIDIYLIYSDGISNLIQNGPANVSSDNNQNSDSSEQATNNVKTDVKPFLKDVRVVYVKDSGNKEVVADTEETKTNGDKRLNATSTISDLEVILNEDDFTKLMDQVLAKGAQLYITYH
ncbi:hypothetical protein FAY30_26360 (plasmid) [Bacillus sp. S3]|uniref:flagella basal body P-ring formation protein FlgA n=1 Tax=Bacillus sp. S3 TaxID=486398 RepID=UPI00118D1AD3|nr:flagella basal body P-ring formation protein FlgA [Bacillus sp. S3]QCJ45466.1 hypothetical protein FAY30_26360 [Bacillus sp. S3]